MVRNVEYTIATSFLPAMYATPTVNGASQYIARSVRSSFPLKSPGVAYVSYNSPSLAGTIALFVPLSARCANRGHTKP